MNENTAHLIHEEKTYILRKGLYAVHNEVGLGKSEEIYHKAFLIWLSENRIPFTTKEPHPIFVGGERVHTLYPDIVAWDSIVVELKSKPCRFRDGDWVQIYEYLKIRNERLGLLVNMGFDRVVIERVIRTETPPEIIEDWEAWDLNRNPSLDAICGLFRGYFTEHQTGYGSEITAKILYGFLEDAGIDFFVHPQTESHFHGTSLGNSPLDCVVLNRQTVLCHTCLFDDNHFNCSRVKSFMRSLAVPYGLAVNFGKKALEIQACRA